MYNCKICQRTTSPGQSRLIHVIYRKVMDMMTGLLRPEIEEEVPVCSDCKRKLDKGVSYDALVKVERPASIMRDKTLKEWPTRVEVRT